jgi:hypothetical protein
MQGHRLLQGRHRQDHRLPPDLRLQGQLLQQDLLAVLVDLERDKSYSVHYFM